MGEAPDWYPLMQAARYLGVAPWELLSRPFYWIEWALAAQSAENEAERQLTERQSRKAK